MDPVGWESALTGSYIATFPAFDCGASVDWYISLNSADGDVCRKPSRCSNKYLECSCLY